MGNQHNTHIANASGEVVRVVLTDRDNRNTTKVIQPKQHVCIPTPHGRVSVDVFRQTAGEKGSYQQFYENSESNFTDDSDYSFIIKKNGSNLDVVRSKYGDIWQEDEGLR